MKLFIYLLILFVFFSVLAKAQQIKAIPTSDNPIFKERPADYEILSAPDSLGIRRPLKRPSQGKSTNKILLPYPIIFIHGLNSNASTWDTSTNFMDAKYGLNFGGRFDFCLNFDGDNTIANTNFWPTPGADIAFYTNTSEIEVGDYYYLNFGVGSDGSVFPTSSNPYYVLSEQAAIVKQGYALKWAIYYVLQKTGRDKVILMGHSMGGLASREYLQNSNLWQPDGKNHVAKLVTTGTPHGGSNASMSELIDEWPGIDDQSDAVRDLRASYYYSDKPGVFLFGGIESNSVMDDMAFDNFYNVDVNCNGILGENVVGLNHKNIPTAIDYSCIIGECSGCINSPGDGVVCDSCANLNNYYPGLNANLFYYHASALSEIHTDLPSQIYQNMQGLDEPNEFDLAYHIGFDTTYTAFTTVQPADGYMYDYDDFKFSVPVTSNVSVIIKNIFIPDLMVHIVDLTGHTIGTTIHSANLSSMHLIQKLNAGDYYIEIYGKPTTTSYLHPYNFKLTKTPVVNGIDYTEKPDTLLIYPNPATNTLNIKGITSKSTIKLYDMLGKLVMQTETESDETLNTSQLTQGVYTFVAEDKRGSIFKKVIITK